ncbi:MAG TPA: inositol monophosphatase family protein [Beijerinckiaceae bacterium]|nr:inositol monophosphatase family protein [Beijerinckiaceae bacterium]
MTPANEALDLRLFAAAAIAREAGGLARRHFRNRPKTLHINFKGDQDYVSATDAEVEALIRTRLHETFPGDGFYGEEGGGTFGDSVWVVDPIDGTANFMRRIPQFCISIAFVRDGRCEVGVIYDPIQDELFAARRGGGARLDGHPMHVSGLADIRQATVEAGWSTRLPSDAYTALVQTLKNEGAGVRRGGSGALALAYVADGRVDAYCELHMNSWDALAGLLLVQEAGGWTNDFLANEGLTQGNPILGCTPALTDILRRAMGLK